MYLKLVLTTFFWGGTFVAARFAMGEAPPFFAASCRFIIASIVLIPLAARQSRREPHGFPLPENFRQMAGLFSLGLTGVFLYNAVFFTGLKHTTATNGALIVAINPLLTAVLSALWLREKVRATQLAGLLVSLFGVAVVIARGSLELLGGLSFNRGDLIMLGAPLCWALYSILGKKALARFTPLAATAYASLIGALLLIPAALLEHAAAGGAMPGFSPLGWLAILQLALLGTVVGFVWWYEGVQLLGTARAAAFVNLVPLFGAVLAALFLGERLIGAQLWGGSLVLLGVYWGSRQPSRPGVSPAAAALKLTAGKRGARKFPATVLCTLQLMFWAMFPAADAGTAPLETHCGMCCAPRQIRGGMGRFLNSRGELRLFFPRCLAIAAPLVLFRLKREGFSNCSVEASDQGLFVQGRR